jgi:hypothetical protein
LKIKGGVSSYQKYEQEGYPQEIEVSGVKVEAITFSVFGLLFSVYGCAERLFLDKKRDFS